MANTREESDTARIPKRQKTIAAQQACNSAARVVEKFDDAIWTSIIEFPPIPQYLDTRVKAENTTAISEVVATWRTLLNLRLVSTELAALLHPVDNALLLKRLVLQSFDFSRGWSTFNVENNVQDHGLAIPEDENEDDEPPEEEVDEDEASDEEEDENESDDSQGIRDDELNEASKREELEEEENDSEDEETEEDDPQREAMRGRYHEIPREYLEEDLVRWGRLGISHRPSQYAFLATLQQQPPVGEWPEEEDAFTLLGDLVRLLMLPHGDGMMTDGEGRDTMIRYLAAPAEADSSSAYFRFYVMKTLEYEPHFWYRGRGIGEEWGSPDQEDFDSCVAEELSFIEADTEDEVDGDAEDFGAHDGYGFQSCNVADERQLYRNLRQHCQDWRVVGCNQGWDGISPDFYMGESKAMPHRWIGYAGQKTWT